MKRLFLALSVIICATLSANAQRHSIKVKYVDNNTGEAIEFATVSVIPEKSDKASSYALTDEKGAVEIKSLKAGTYVVKSELLGYEPAIDTVKLADKNIDLGTRKMMVQVNQLEEASVTAIGNPIIIKKDTIEYNASSFRTTDNDMLEELLKKLPGVEVDASGAITSNGKTISKITIDGKTFFMNDPQLATKNIPAKIIEKVKILEQKSEQARFTGIDDGNEETIIDLSIQKGMMG
ncbi:MAG: carboxypeptidase regulatory-like domain-containing protein, partial [Bacteroidales bacterium]|nr:carboxypeptidase regulatory-like domain-containing protein [Bacteroidales bacterium]